jgi:hypothetical protein
MSAARQQTDVYTIFIQYIHSEISEAQDKFTNLLQRIYLNQPNGREIVRLVMTCVGRGGQGDVGQRIRDEILVLQVLINYHLSQKLKLLQNSNNSIVIAA